MLANSRGHAAAAAAAPDMTELARTGLGDPFGTHSIEEEDVFCSWCRDVVEVFD